MGIVNVTPDSFSDGGMYGTPEEAIDHGVRLAEEGADIIDVGGESTRPGAAAVSAAQELKRILPVIEGLAARVSVPISVDTTKAAVAEKALEAGAEIVNDVSALRFDPRMGEIIASRNVPVVLMHMRGTPRTMQQDIHYDSLLDEIRSFLEERISCAVRQGITREKIIIDPGIGFGKAIEKDNFTILKHLAAFQDLGRPILVGPSRKASISRLAGQDIDARDTGTAAAAAIAVYQGAHIVRVHNVSMTKIAVTVADAIRRA